jgi:iron-sulfur cluster insertion protein
MPTTNAKDKMMPNITLTSDALIAALGLQQTEPSYHGLPLRLYIEGKGCDGFYYGATFANREPDDLAFKQGDLELVIDQSSLEFIDGSTIEWVNDERGTGFLFKNPNHTRYRGKFYKRKSWQEKFSSSSQSPT